MHETMQLICMADIHNQDAIASNALMLAADFPARIKQILLVTAGIYSYIFLGLQGTNTCQVLLFEFGRN